MSQAPAEQDNSIEEILASIRQIISEDQPKQVAAVSVAAPAAAAPEPVVELAPEPPAPIEVARPAEDDVFELVDRVVAEPEPEFTNNPVPPPMPAIEVDMRDVMEEPAMPSTPPIPPRPMPDPLDIPLGVDDEALFTDTATAATLGAFSKLSETILVERQRAISGSNITLEDIVKDLLAPLLREWIDKNVPRLVENLVREELEKLARHARDS